ncbi:ESPR-type extended signal peptide-containing protein, partial [Halomonas sp. 86]|uniref:ESPR-type extended signal peptide-containing protein n=1 Tax=unclassified Halomonas TaxID=2609666 RepID=UPI004034E72A
MNRVFRLIWKQSLGRLVVASEIAQSNQKAAGSSGVVGSPVLVSTPYHIARNAFRLSPLVLAMALTGGAAYAQVQTSVSSGNNIVVTPDDEDNPAVYTVSTENDVTFNNITTNELTVNGAAILSALQVTGAATLSGGLAMGNSQITGLANATASDHAVNFSQLSAVSDAANAGWNISAGGGSSENVAPGDSVDFSGDSNINVSRSETGTDLSFSLASQVTVDELTAGNTSIDTNGLTIDGGPSVTSAGINAGGNKITNVKEGDLTAGSTDAVTGKQIFDLFIEEGAGGVRYFRTNSTADDSRAGGEESVAIGPNTVTEGDSSFAAGDTALTREGAEGAIALGQNAIAGTEDATTLDGEGSIALGRNSQASGNRTIALGDGAEVESEFVTGALALGTDASVSGINSDNALAIGNGAAASAANATALGNSSAASGAGSIALGDATANAANGLAAGTGAYSGAPNSISLGTNAGVGTNGTAAGDQTSHIAVGTGAGQNVIGNQTTAIGFGAGSSVNGIHNVAIGSHAGANVQGNYNVAIGHEANRNAGAIARATAIGGQTNAARDAVALGYDAESDDSGVAVGANSVAGNLGVALGHNSSATGGSVALGSGSAAISSDATGPGYLTGSSFIDGTVVSVGNTNPSGVRTTRRIVNVADGAQLYDAVNVNQLQATQRSVAGLIGGNVTVDAEGNYSPITVGTVGGGTASFDNVVEAIGAVTSGTVDILPVDAVRYNANGSIDVAAGVDNNEAVNVGQMNQAIDERSVKYFSVNSSEPANRDNAEASGIDAIAIGPATAAGGRSSLAGGHLAQATGNESVALGYEVEALGDNSTVVGSGSDAYGDRGVAIGFGAESHGENSVVMGTGAHAHPKNTDTSVDNAIVIGTDAESTADEGIAIGRSALASEVRAVAQGSGAHATAADALAQGTQSRASGVSSQASGTDARASGTNSIASGTNSRGYAANGIALGTSAISGIANPLPGQQARNANAIAIGNSALADELSAQAVGFEARARGETSAAFGAHSEALGLDALAVGTGARATEQSASAIGRGTQATAQDSSALGQGATASAIGALATGSGSEANTQNASAIGQGSRALHENAVALGADSVTEEATPVTDATVNSISYDGFAGTSPTSVVSVGNNGVKRQITNVAAGRISETSTDAINGSQLFATQTVIGNVGQSTVNVLGGNAALGSDGTITTSDVGGTGEDNVHNAIEFAAQGWDVGANGQATGNVAPGGSVDFSGSDGNIDIARNGTNLTFGLNDDVTVGNSITTNNLTVSGETRLGDRFVVNSAGDVNYGGNELATQADGLSFAGNTGGTINKALSDTTPLTISGGLGNDEATTGANLRVDGSNDQLNLVMARDLTSLD